MVYLSLSFPFLSICVFTFKMLLGGRGEQGQKVVGPCIFVQDDNHWTASFLKLYNKGLQPTGWRVAFLLPSL